MWSSCTRRVIATGWLARSAPMKGKIFTGSRSRKSPLLFQDLSFLLENPVCLAKAEERVARVDGKPLHMTLVDRRLIDPAAYRWLDQIQFAPDLSRERAT